MNSGFAIRPLSPLGHAALLGTPGAPEPTRSVREFSLAEEVGQRSPMYPQTADRVERARFPRRDRQGLRRYYLSANMGPLAGSHMTS